MAYWGQLGWWRVWHPRLTGAAVAVWHEGRVLVIRNSYRRALTLPAGGLKRREDHRAAAARELREEVGIDVPAETLRYVGEFLEITRYADDHLHLYELRCPQAPKVCVDGREVVWARFLTPAEALEGGATGVFGSYLRGLAA